MTFEAWGVGSGRVWKILPLEKISALFLIGTGCTSQILQILPNPFPLKGMKWSALQALLKMCLVCNFTFFDLEGLKLHTILVFTIVAIKFLEQDFIYRCLKSETFGELGGKGWGRGGGGGHRTINVGAWLA